MASENEINAETEDVCVVCCKKVTIFAIGTCDHPVCYECSTRMRVLCKQNECPICRRDMQKVIFTETKDTFTVLMERINSKTIVLQDKSINVIFASISIQKSYLKLLEHRCPVCTKPSDQYPHRFRTFNDLKEHVRREHELFYCDLCVANLKIFTTERRCYTRQERATHRRKGDADNKSHRGHPLCQFCDTRYMDLDELFRHLRRDHFYCHFCDMETANNQYYNSYDDLRAHFSQDHYLCEEGNCRLEQFTSVFKSLIDLKAHQASIHSKDLSKNAVKQARTVEVAFTLKPRQQKVHQNNSTNHYSNHSNQSNSYSNHSNYLNNDEEGAVGYDNSSKVAPKIHLDPNSSTDFPRLTPDMNIPSSSNTVRLSISKRNRPETNLSIKMSVPMSSSVQIRPKWNDFPALTEAGNSKVEVPRWVRSAGNTKPRPETSNGAILKVNPSDFRSPRRNLGSLSDFPELIQREKLERSEKNEKTSQKSNEIVKKRSTVTLECNLGKKDVKNDIKKRNEKVKKKKKVGEIENDSFDRLKRLNLVGIDESEVSYERKVTKKVSELKINPLKSDFFSDNEVNQDYNKKSNEKTCQNSNEKSYQNSKDKSNQDNNQKNYRDNAEKSYQKRNENSPQKSHRNIKLKSDQQQNQSNDQQNNEKISQKSHQNINLKNSQKNNQQNNEKNHENNNQQSSKQSITENPPPGFSTKKLKPPPGFEGLQTLLPSEMTFTNSTGQSFPILTSNSTYKPPKDFEKRNENLIKNLNQVVTERNDITSIIEFKRYSALFRNGDYNAKAYYDLCRATMEDSFDRLFPELLILLPDVAKQRELFEEHLKRTDDKKGLEVCLKCDQVVLKRDLSEHFMAHALESNFPVLKTTQQPEVEMNYWRK